MNSDIKKNNSDDKSNDKSKPDNILAFFYFILIFGVVIYLFFALFGKSYMEKREEMNIFNGGYQGMALRNSHIINMKFSDFIV